MEKNRRLTDEEINSVMNTLEILGVRIEEIYKSPHVMSNITTEDKFPVNLERNVKDVVCAVIDRYPNPEFGKPPCHFDDPLVMAYQQLNDGKMMLSISAKLVGDEKVMVLAREALREIKENNVFDVSLFQFSAH